MIGVDDETASGEVRGEHTISDGLRRDHTPVGHIRLTVLFVRRTWLVMAGMVLAVVEAVRKGADTYFDFLNIKWVMGWLLANGDFNLKGIATTRKWGPPYVDVWNAVLATIGVWWIPAVIHGLVHALIVPSVFLLARRVSPLIPGLFHQIVAVLSISVPLVFMQVGTSTGHLYSALPLLWTLHLLLRVRDAIPAQFSQAEVGIRRSITREVTGAGDPWRAVFMAGAVMALSPLLKPSALSLVPAHLVGAFLLIGSLARVVAFLVGFLSCYFFWAIGWATVVAAVTESSPLLVQSPGLPLSGPPLSAFAVVVIAIGTLWWLMPRSRFRLPQRYDESHALVVAGMLLSLPLSWQFAGYLRVIAADYRWFIYDYLGLLKRLLHAGDLQNGFQTVDLESAYFDTSIPLAMALLGSVILLLPVLFSRRATQRWGPRIGLVWFATYPFLYNMWATGYTRYASQVVPMVGVAGLAIFALHSKRGVRITGSMLVLLALALPHLLTNRVSAEIPRFGQVAYDEPIYDNYVSGTEVGMLNALIPAHSTVLVIGTLNTYLIPQLGRSDLEWWFWKPKRHEVATMSGNIIVMFSPGDSDRLPEYAEQGLLYDDCSVLRFRRTSVGLCIGSVDPAMRTETPGST